LAEDDFYFCKSIRRQIGDSICEDDKQGLALEILRLAKEKGVQIHIPVDVTARKLFEYSQYTNRRCQRNSDGWQGGRVQNHWSSSKVIMDSKTIFGTDH
jgi:phosphoglycerate kinase